MPAQDSSQLGLLKELLDLQKDMVVMLLSLLEGTGERPVPKVSLDHPGVPTPCGASPRLWGHPPTCDAAVSPQGTW